MSDTTHTIELSVGYESKGSRGEEAVRHTRVVFGKRLTGAVLMAIHDDPQSNIPTQHQLMLLRGGITQFGELPIPVLLTVLLALDSIDIEDLVAANDRYLALTQEGRAPEFVSDSEVKLAFGFEDNGLVYNRVRFGRRVVGRDLVDAEKKGYAELRRECYLIGREVERLTTEDGAHVLDGPIELQVFEQLDAYDITTLRAASMGWRDSFRKSRKGVPAGGAQRDDSGGADGVGGGGASESPARPA